MVGRDIASPRWLYIKASLFLAIATISGSLLYLGQPNWTTAALVLLVAWASARAYYFCFYVIEHYADPTFRYAGIADLAIYLLRRSSGRAANQPEEPCDGTADKRSQRL